MSQALHPAGSKGLGPAGRIAGFFVGSKLTPLLVVAALALGLLAIALTPREEEPQIVVPMVDVFVGLPGASPQEVENRLTVPLEKRLWEIPGVEYVYSASMSGSAMVTARFLVGEDQERSLVKVYEKLVSGMPAMPSGATPPLVQVRTIDDVPVLAFTLWSRLPPDRGGLDGFELRRLAAELGRELAALDEVSDIRITGGEERQVRVFLDPDKLAAARLDPVAVVRALPVQNAALDAGSIESGGLEVLVETQAFLRSADEVGAIVVGVDAVGVDGGRPIYLRDVARVLDGAAEATTHVSFAQGPGGGEHGGAAQALAPGEYRPAVTLSLAKRKGSDAARLVERLRARVEELRGSLIPESVELTVTRDYGATASEKANELLVHLLGAIAAVTVVIGLALGWRGALVVFVSVPVSFALTLFVYYVFGYTLNRVTLFALIFVTGIVVDDSIIVVENIVRHLRIGKLPPLRATLVAVSEVGNPTILATLTVIASVLPMAFVRGLMGPYMRPMPIGASLAMIFSLLVALIAAPWLAYRLLRGSQEVGPHGEHVEHDELEVEGYHVEETRLFRVYRRLLEPLMKSARKRWLFLGTVTALLLAAVALVPLQLVSLKMLPFDNKSELQVIVDVDEGTTLEQTSRVARAVADSLLDVAEVRDVQVYAGTAAPINFNGLVRHYDLRSGPNVADVQVNFVHKDERSEQSHDLALRIRPRIEAIAERFSSLGASIKITEVPPGPPVLSTLVAEVYGPSHAERVRVAEQVRSIFRETPGVVDVDWMVDAEQPKRVFRVDHEKAALHGVPAARVVEALRLALEGGDAGRLHLEDELEPVTVRVEVPRAMRSSLGELGRLSVRSRSGAAVPLGELVRIEDTVRQTTLHRKNLLPVVYVTAEVASAEGGESPAYAILDMADEVDGIELPAGGTIAQHYRNEPTSTERAALKWDGEWHITYEVFRDLGAAFGAVLLLIYVLIIGWFGSFRVPLVMMIAIPLSLVGILPGHALFGAFFTATSMIGFIALAGIMVRNSVLLIDFVNLALERGQSLEDAVLEAGAVRFRPILLTAGTVVVGAFVILFDPIFEGLAISLLTGALASTVLTLVVVPLVHYMVESRVEHRVERRSARADAATGD